MIDFTVAAGLERMVRPGLVAAVGLEPGQRDEAMHEAVAASERTLRAACDLGHVVAAVRAMYRQFGVDPTKTRPSSEALLRRIRRGEPLPRINTVVDIGNWCSVETQLPYGLYDLDRIEGPVELRLGADGEEYAGIRKDVVHVAGRLVVADTIGPFGNPTSDSARASVSDHTRRVLVVTYAPATLGDDVVDHALALTCERLTRYVGAQIIGAARVGDRDPGPEGPEAPKSVSRRA